MVVPSVMVGIRVREERRGFVSILHRSEMVVTPRNRLVTPGNRLSER